MRFEWDPVKNALNIRKHGLSFEDAHLVFAELVVSGDDTRHTYGEARSISYGLLRGRLVQVVHTTRGDTIRIISMRKANAREQARYQE